MSRRSLKVIPGLAAIIVAAYGGASWYAGRLAQQSVEAWATRVNQEIQDQWTSADPRPVLRVDDYRRGIFSSQVRYAFEFRDDHGATQTLKLEDHLQHGPWPLAAVKAGFWRPLAAFSRVRPLPGGPWQPWFDALPGGTTPWEADSRVGFDGHVASDWRFAPVHAADKSLDFSGGAMTLDYDPGARRTVLSGHVDKLDVQDVESGGGIWLEDLAFDSSTARSGDADLQSRQQVRMKQARLLAPGSGEVVLLQPSIGMAAARTGSLLDSRVQYDLGQVRVGARDLGTMQLKASVDQVDIPALRALILALDRIQAERGDSTPLSARDEQRLRTLMIPVLASSPRVSLDTVNWVTPEGRTEIRAQAQFRPAGDDAPQDLGGLIEHGIAQISAYLQVSKPMLLQALRQSQTGANPDMAVALFSMMFDQYAGRLERQGLVSQQDGQVQTEIRYADGRLNVNGTEMAPAEFAGRFDSALGLGN